MLSKWKIIVGINSYVGNKLNSNYILFKLFHYSHVHIVFLLINYGNPRNQYINIRLSSSNYYIYSLFNSILQFSHFDLKYIVKRNTTNNTFLDYKRLLGKSIIRRFCFFFFNLCLNLKMIVKLEFYDIYEKKGRTIKSLTMVLSSY